MNALPPIAQRTLSTAFERALKDAPDKLAFIDSESRQSTYRQAYDAALLIGGGLGRLQLGHQAPVAMMLDNSLDFVHLAFGVALTGRIQVPINTAYKGEFLTHILNDSGAEVLVIEARYVERLVLIAGDLKALRQIVVRGDAAALGHGFKTMALDALSAGPAARAAVVSASDLMGYMYTSGTTGLSKGVEVTHAHAYTYASREDVGIPSADDRILVTLPLFHLAGQWYGVYQSLIAGACCVVQAGFSVSQFWQWVREHRITETIMLGAMAELLQQAAPRPDDADNSLRFAVMAPLASDFVGFGRRFGVQLAAVYGMTEIGAVMVSNPPDVVAGEAGRARPGYTLKLVDDAGAEVPVDVPGELWVRPESPLMVLRGYHGLPEKTAETLVDGWVRTGDVFRRDAAGHFFFMDRKKDALRRRGENISSFEVERALNAHPAVFESAVIAVPSALGEDEIKAVIVPRDGHAIDWVELTEFMNARVPYFMVPRYFESRDALPRTPTQKVQKHLLRAAGMGEGVWDREAAGIVLSRRT